MNESETISERRNALQELVDDLLQVYDLDEINELDDDTITIAQATNAFTELEVLRSEGVKCR
ncbi:hypothetical protein ACFPTR_05640 [Aliibacillus thermotolerans]|uniref:Uncharacterized protein n=1 Tax=Aliibacillus thermotolerans TaxID=1834418 RepID=A0ABW0U6G6_9BACI|nr:hypothetical protein [Aliibacillus thermotolerans]MDA3130966.1 hypothetical protein [Aliibacillus thermotolerans]